MTSVKMRCPGRLLAAAAILLVSAGCVGSRVAFPERYACPRAAGEVTIDGRLDESAWWGAEVVRPFGLVITHRPPVYATQGRVMWDDEFLYIGFWADDDDVKSVFTERDSDTYRDDVLEVFFKTAPDATSHYNFEINALGVVKDEYHTAAKPYQTGWNCEGIRIAASVLGTMNASADRDRRWQLEVAIPFAGLPSLDGRIPKPGDTWLFHLARIERSAYLETGPELSSSAKLKKKWFHTSREWTPLVFRGAE